MAIPDRGIILQGKNLNLGLNHLIRHFFVHKNSMFVKLSFRRPILMHFYHIFCVARVSSLHVLRTNPFCPKKTWVEHVICVDSSIDASALYACNHRPILHVGLSSFHWLLLILCCSGFSPENRRCRGAMEEERVQENIVPGITEESSRVSSRIPRKCFTYSRAWKVYQRKTPTYWVILFLSSCSMMVAFPASSLLSRLYYVDGGKSRWILSWIAVAGWPLTATFLLLFYFREGISPTPLTWKLGLSYAVLGFLSAADNLMFSWAYSYLPASTSSLLASSSLTFTAIFAYLIVKKKLNASTFNAVVIITTAAVIIGLDSGSDRPAGITDRQYAMGFLWDILGSALHGLIFALSELLFIKILGRKSFHVILEQQAVVSVFACIFTTIGVIVNGDFTAMKSEAATFKHGAMSYFMVLFWGAVTFQLGILGSVAVLYLTSTLMAGVLNAVRVPVTSIAAVVCFHDPMGGFKIVSLLLTIWGFGCYIYGSSSEIKANQQLDDSSNTGRNSEEALAVLCGS